jgi:hypothetical protein
MCFQIAYRHFSNDHPFPVSYPSRVKIVQKTSIRHAQIGCLDHYHLCNENSPKSALYQTDLKLTIYVAWIVFFAKLPHIYQIFLNFSRMKRIFISGVFVLLGLAVLAQPIGSGTLQLSVRGGPGDLTLEFKPGKRLKLKTKTGEVIYTWKYAITDDYVLTEKNQLIYYHDIVRIKARVMKDTGRVVAGTLLVATGVVLAGSTIAIATLALTPGSFLLLLTLEARMILGGVQSMKQYRTFTMDKGWEIQTYLAGE